MFNLFSRRTTKDFVKQVQSVYGSPMTWRVGPEAVSESKDLYRVGVTPAGMTTLTLTADGTSMTLTMDEAGFEQLIKTIRSTYPNEKEAKDGSKR